jgi:hypothetical protein
MKKNIILFVCLIISGISFAQQFDTKPLLDSIRKKMNRVNDYSADIQIKLNVSFIKIPVKTATIYFKKPNKVKMKTAGFAMLPKQSASFNAGDFLSNDFSSFFVKSELINGVPNDVIKVVPMSNDGEIILATMWIDRRKQLVNKIDATTKSNGNFLMEFRYPKIANVYDMPELLKFTLDITKTTLPVSITGDFDSDKKIKKSDEAKKQKATLSISYSNYKINTGIPDSFFIEEKKKK